MPYTREGALKVSDHWVRSPLLNISRSCQVCHAYPEEEIRARADAIQNRTHALMQRTATALTEMLSAGSSTLAIRTSGRDFVAAALERAISPFRLSNGGYRLENRFRFVIATRD